MKLFVEKMVATLRLLFPTRKFRSILFGLVLLSAIISVSELVVAKFFTKIISHEHKLTSEQMLTYTLVLLFCFVLTRVGHFLQKIGRVSVFDGSFKTANLTGGNMQESWQWSLAFEVSNILGVCTQLIVVAVFFIVLNPAFSALNFVMLIVILFVYGALFRHQLGAQQGFRESRKQKKVVANSVRVGTRIRSGELGALVSGFGMIILLTVLLYMSYKRDIPPGDAIVFFFGLKMQTSNLATFSAGLMRFARALANSE
ncbi:MAG: hypothetical protein WDO06_01735 [Actinomycetota bacterium]